MRAGTGRSVATSFVARFGIPILALGAPWYAKTALATGNPVYPFAFEVFGGRDWSTALAAQFGNWHAALGMGREPLDYLLLPLRVLVQPDHFGDALG